MERPKLDFDCKYSHKSKAFYKTDYSDDLEKYADYLEQQLKRCDLQITDNKVLTDVITPLPSDVIDLLKQVRFTFSNYESGTNGKDMSNDADELLKKYFGNDE